MVLGFLFLYLQATEYVHAYSELGLTLGTGVYGATFFLLTGFHGAHVTIGAIILTVILIRCIRGHFKPDQHFGFEAAAGTGTLWTPCGWWTLYFRLRGLNDRYSVIT